MTLSTQGKNDDLDSSYGVNKGSEWPATLYYALSVGDMLATPTPGVELDNTGGYARASSPNNAFWNPASGGSKTNAQPLQFPISSGAWSHQPDHFAIMDAATGGNILETGTINLVSAVSGANIVVSIAAGQLVIGF